MGKLRIGILGASRGMDFARQLLKNYEYAELTAVCESYEVLRKKTENYLSENGFHSKCYSDYDEFLDSGLDAVIIANYANEHCGYAIRALKRGIHVLSEVQPVQTLAEACELCDAVEASGCIYSYAENYCYFDTNFTMRRLYEAGEIGEAVCLEGTFCNDCSWKWNLLTRGQRDHWRNYVPSTFYCTHSIGPMLYSTGLRAVRVNGLEIPRMEYMAEKGARSGSAAMEVMELDNGGIARSLNGNLRYPYEASYRLIGEKGSIVSTVNGVRLYRHTSEAGFDIRDFTDTYTSYRFRPHYKTGNVENGTFAAFAYFIGAIFGDDEGKKYTIDVYRAMDMAIPGLLAYRSIIDGCAPYTVPDLRDNAQRDAYRNDRYCTDPRTPEEYRLPTSKSGTPEVDDSVYQRVRESFSAVNLTPGGK